MLKKSIPFLLLCASLACLGLFLFHPERPAIDFFGPLDEFSPLQSETERIVKRYGERAFFFNDCMKILNKEKEVRLLGFAQAQAQATKISDRGKGFLREMAYPILLTENWESCRFVYADAALEGVFDPDRYRIVMRNSSNLLLERLP